MGEHVPASLRIPLERAKGPPTAEEQRRLEVADLLLESIELEGNEHISRWRSVSSGFVGSLVLRHDDSISDLACAYFYGPDRVELATRLVPLFSYMPIELMHLSARSSPVAGERFVGFASIGQVYRQEDGVSYWDSNAEVTLGAAMQEPDPETRLAAFSAIIRANPPTLKAHMAKALKSESSPSIRERLEQALSESMTPPASSAPPIPLWFADDLLATPFFRIEPLEAAARRFEADATVVSKRTTEIGGSTATEFFEAKCTQLDAGVTYMASVDSNLGCAYFSGSDRVVLAIGASSWLKYFPTHLAKLAARHARHPGLRIMGIRALAFAGSQRMSPSSSFDPDIQTILTSALQDSDPDVRLSATHATVLLRDELASRNSARPV